eukprot:COSAG02_NODE_22838_length_739_cov_0.792188_2_plen_131_part_01
MMMMVVVAGGMMALAVAPDPSKPHAAGGRGTATPKPWQHTIATLIHLVSLSSACLPPSLLSFSPLCAPLRTSCWSLHPGWQRDNAFQLSSCVGCRTPSRRARRWLTLDVGLRGLEQIVAVRRRLRLRAQRD